MALTSLTLPNGIRLVHYPVQAKVAHCGLFINAGTRDELEHEHGIAHFIEHTIFKGTKKRNVFQVLNRLENIGADLNAFTTKEETCIYATFLSEYYDRTLELFHDLFFNAIFPEKELEKEKQVVLDEIKACKDNPAEQIFDDFEDLVFAGHPLGKNILGTKSSLKQIDRKAVFDFIHRNYRMEQVVIASVGNIDFASLTKRVMKYFMRNPDRGNMVPRHPFSSYSKFHSVNRKKTSQVHCVVGGPAYCFSDTRRIPMALLNNMLGGPILNSRLSLALRERNGLTYHNESNYTAYSDSGIVSIYFGTDPVHFDKALAIVFKELKKLRETRLTPIQFHTIQKQLIGQLSIAQESNLSAMLAMGKNFLLKNEYDPPELLMELIRRTTAAEVMEIANQVFDASGLSMLTFRS